MTKLKIFQMIKDNELTIEMKIIKELTSRESLNTLMHHFANKEKKSMRDVYFPITYLELGAWFPAIEEIEKIIGLEHTQALANHYSGGCMRMLTINSFKRFRTRYLKQNSDKTVFQNAVSLGIDISTISKNKPKGVEKWTTQSK